MLPGESLTETFWPLTIDGGKMRGHTAHEPVFPLTASQHTQVFVLHQRLVQPKGFFCCLWFSRKKSCLLVLAVDELALRSRSGSFSAAAAFFVALLKNEKLDLEQWWFLKFRAMACICWECIPAYCVLEKQWNSIYVFVWYWIKLITVKNFLLSCEKWRF